MREWDLGIEDQSSLGSCVGNSVATVYEILVMKQFPEKSVHLSRLFIYYNGRLLEGSETMDDGVSVKSAVQGVYKYGVCTESLWPYDITMFDDEPTKECYDDASNRRITEYRKVSNVTDMIDALDSGYPIVIGMSTFSGFSYLKKENSILRIPAESDLYTGAHSVAVVGYDIATELFLAKNSYGSDWGDGGYCWIPFGYAERYFFDMWVFDITG